MEKQYYIHKNGLQEGPLSFAELKLKHITPTTMVWCPGMPSWVQAQQLPELQPLFNPLNNFGSQSGYNQYPGGSPYNPNMQPPGWVNWLPWAIVGTVLGFLGCCLGMIFGIIGIVKANKANTLLKMGDYQQAEYTNSTAKTWTIVSLVLGGISCISLLFFFFLGVLDFAALMSAYNI